MEKNVLKIGNQEFDVGDYLDLRSCEFGYEKIYAILEYNKILFFISEYFAKVIVSNSEKFPTSPGNFLGYIHKYHLQKFLNQRKVIFKDYYYDLAYKNPKEITNNIVVSIL